MEKSQKLLNPEVSIFAMHALFSFYKCIPGVCIQGSAVHEEGRGGQTVGYQHVVTAVFFQIYTPLLLLTS